MESHLELWERVRTPDPEYTRPFEDGGFQGTAISPMWFIRAATREFGPVGIGWGYEVLSEGFINASDKEQVHSLHLRLWYTLDGKRGELSHFGQTRFTGGQKVDGDVKKKSLTDALTKCLSMLGFAADVYLGRFDDLKYIQSLVNQREVEPRAPSPAAPEHAVSLLPAPKDPAVAKPDATPTPAAGKAPAPSSAAPTKDAWITRIRTLGRDALGRVEVAVQEQFSGQELQEILTALSQRKTALGVSVPIA